MGAADFELTPPPEETGEARVFLGWIADRYEQRVGFTRRDAMACAKATFEAFGDEDEPWTRSWADYLADEDMACWRD